MEEICIVIVQKLIYQVDKDRPSKLKKFYFDDHLKWHTLKFLVLIWSGIFEACLSVGLKIFDLSCKVFSLWKIKSKFCQFISWTNWVNSGKFMENYWISCHVMADMKKVHNDLTMINLYSKGDPFAIISQVCLRLEFQVVHRKGNYSKKKH